MCLITLSVLGLLACASTPPGNNDNRSSIDPYEGFNRAIFAFNNGLDTYFMKPIAQGYRYVTPNFVETGVSNFFSNLLEVRNVFNAGLQGKGHKVLHYTGRFLINSTFGILGLFDIAHPMGLEKTEGEDFGQTLATWGIGSGPYVVLPFLGPSTIRDSIGIPVDAYVDPINYLDHVRTRNSLTAGELVDKRVSLLDAEELISGDSYIFIRDAYLQRRNYLVEDGQVDDSFGESLEDF